MKWLDRLLISLNLRKTQPLRAAAIEPEPEAMAGPDWKDGDTLPFVHRQAVMVPLSQIPPIPRRGAHRLHAVAGDRADNAMGDPWVPPGAGGYGAAASQVESGEAPAPAPAFKSGSGGAFGGGGAGASWGSSDSGCSSGGDGGPSGGCGGSD